MQIPFMKAPVIGIEKIRIPWQRTSGTNFSHTIISWIIPHSDSSLGSKGIFILHTVSYQICLKYFP